MQLAGTIIDGKFELLDEIGSGGFATVYRAKQLRIERNVALKLLHPASIDDNILKRFEREARILQGFQTKFIPTIYGYGVWENRPYMALELVSGVSLADVIRRDKRMSLERLKPIVTAVAEGLAYAHSQGVVHRDLSPSNIILVNQQGMPDARIIDFGLATFTEFDLRNCQKLTEAGYAVGSFQYMSPEQCMAEPADERSDIYALGCIIYHALIGEVPFTSDNPVLLLAKHVHEPLPRLDDKFTLALQTVLDKATAKDPTNRYQSAEEFLKDWKALDSADSQSRRMPSWVPAPSLGLIASAMLIMVIAGVAALYSQNAQRTASADNMQIRPKENPVALVERAVEIFERRKGLATGDLALNSLIDEHSQLVNRALAIENETHQMSPMQLEVLYKQLSWSFKRKNEIPKAIEYARKAVLLDLDRHVPCNSPLNAYLEVMEAGSAQDQQEFIRINEQILQAQPPYNAALKQIACVGIADALAHLGEFKKAREVLPPGPEVINEVEKNYRRALDYIREHDPS
jgi:serine/threonine-protein kinase